MRFLWLKSTMLKNAGKIIGYIRTSTDKQCLTNQQHEILSYTNKNNLKVHEFIEIQISSRRTLMQRRIDELLAKLDIRDTLIVTELSRLGRSTSEILALVNDSPYARSLFLRKFINSFIDAIFAATSNLYLMAK